MPPPPRGDANRNATGSGLKGDPSQPGQPGQQQQQPGNQFARLTPQQQAMMMQHMYQQQQQRFAAGQSRQAPMNFRPQRRDRNAGVITDDEWREGVEEHVDSGKSFRRWLFIILGLCVLFLAWTKYEMEESIALPPELIALAERDAEVRGEPVRDPTSGKTVHVIDNLENPEQMEEYYKLLNVEKAVELTHEEMVQKAEEALARRRAEATDQATKEKFEGQDALRREMKEQDRLRRLDERRRMQKLRESYEKRQEQYGQLVHCGRSCEAEQQQVQLAYNTLSGKVQRELIGVLLDENIAETGRRSVDPATLKENYEKKKEAIENDATLDDEVKSMELAEIRDAFEILSHPEGRRYYQMTGRKPPEHMKHTSQTHGGWGQELLLRTHKNRLILAWLDYFGTSWADYGVLLVIGCVGFVLPVAMQFPRILEMAKEIEERQIQMEELEKKANEADAAGGAAGGARQ
jgi:hypothetical protein